MVANQSYQHVPDWSSDSIGTVTKSLIITGSFEGTICHEILMTRDVLATGMPKRLDLDMPVRALPSLFSDRGWKRRANITARATWDA
jgi:hypothetical protein